jgi:MFS family permease
MMTATSTTDAAGTDGPAASAAADPAQRRTVVVLVIAQILGTIGLGVAPSIGILLAGEVTDSEAWAGLARTSSTLGAAALGVPLGSLAARRGRRIALTTGWWTAAAGAGLLVAAAQWQLVVPLFLGLLMTGAGTAAALQARFTATDLATPGNRARSLSLVVWMGAIGNVLGPNLGVPGEALGAMTGLSTYAAAFLIAAVGSALAGAVILVLLRPDPLHVLARRQAAALRAEGSARGEGSARAGEGGAELPVTSRPGPLARLRRMAGALRGNRRARTALIALLTSQVVMVSVMTMTPVHLEHHGDSLTVIGLTISLHVAGMFGLAPVVGYLVDRLGHRVVVGLGIVLFALSLGLAIGASASTSGIVVSLILLGLGWSFMNVAASAMFSTVVEDRSRASAQGGADALSNLLGAVAAFVAGPLMAVTSFAALGVPAAVVMIPVVLLVLRPSVWSAPPLTLEPDDVPAPADHLGGAGSS